MKERKKNDVAALLRYAGGHKGLTFLGLALSGIAMLLSMAPYICIWLAARDLIAVAPDWTQAENVAQYGWLAFAFAVGGIVIYFLGLMCTHLAAFRTASNIRKQGVARVMKAPLGYFDANASGLIRGRLDAAAADTETLLAHNLADIVGTVVMFLAMLVLMFVFDWRMGAACLLAAVISVIAMFHDIGAYKTDEISRMLEFETSNVQNHSAYGYLFIKYFTPLTRLAPAVLFHHTPWCILKNLNEISEENKIVAQLLNIADRADIFMEKERKSFPEFVQLLKADGGKKYCPWIAEMLMQDAFAETMPVQEEGEEEFWERLWSFPFTQEEIRKYLDMVIYTIDFRSRHTVTHTMTTTSISYELAKRLGITGQQLSDVYFGALLHDLGKIGIPVEILEFPGKLSPQAMRVMRTHVELTEKILGQDVEEKIKRIALRHHEKMDGSGYPEGISGKDLTMGERIVAVADIVSALAGTRSYKDAFPKERILSIINKMKEDELIDKDVVDKVTLDFDEIMEITRNRCQPILDMYHRIQSEYLQIEGYMAGISQADIGQAGISEDISEKGNG